MYTLVRFDDGSLVIFPDDVVEKGGNLADLSVRIVGREARILAVHGKYIRFINATFKKLSILISFPLIL